LPPQCHSPTLHIPPLLCRHVIFLAVIFKAQWVKLCDLGRQYGGLAQGPGTLVPCQ
jgi:hypothetical protein